MSEKRSPSAYIGYLGLEKQRQRGIIMFYQRSVLSLKSFAFVLAILLSLPTQASDSNIFTATEQGNLEAVRELVQENPQLVTAADDRGAVIQRWRHRSILPD